MKGGRWTPAALGNLAGRRFLVTGGNSGIGLETVRALTRQEASVILASRDTDKGEEAADDVRRDHRGADVTVLPLDLADLDAVAMTVEHYLATYDSLDVLVNNAGVMALPYRQSIDGFEMHLATNHLGHFALTGRLLPALVASRAPRVVTVSSGMHWLGDPRVKAVTRDTPYRKWVAYATTKLCNLRFCFELQRRAAAADASIVSVAAHPGYAHTNLQVRGPQLTGSRLTERLHAGFARAIGQSAAMGALPVVYAAADADVRGGDYIGPDQLGGLRGYPQRVRASGAARDATAAARLWEVSEELTGVRYRF